MDFTDYMKETLRGLQGVTVIVETVNSDIKDLINIGAIQQQIENQLRNEGITVLNMEEWKSCVGKPWLYVSINTIKYLLNYFFTIDVQLRQDVTLPRSQSIMSSCSTWEVGALGFVEKNSISQQLNEYISEYIKKFASDYKLANE